MTNLDIDRLLLAAQTEGGSQISNLLASTAGLSLCAGVILVAWMPDRSMIVGSVGVSIPAQIKLQSLLNNPQVKKKLKCEFVIGDMRKKVRKSGLPELPDLMDRRFMAHTWLMTPWSNVRFSLLSGHPDDWTGLDIQGTAKIISLMGKILADQLLLLSDVMYGLNANDNMVYEATEKFDFEGADDANLISDFLSGTIIEHRRLLKRKLVDYHAIYRWRKPVKDVQLKALKLIKQHGSQNLEQHMADALAGASKSLFGEGAIKLVTNVPCGHGGCNCLIRRVAPLVAEKLGVRYLPTFENLPSAGTSHPKSNVRRPAMKLIEKPSEPVLLLDDVATSGRHIEEAAMKLRKHSPAVIPLVWLSD